MGFWSGISSFVSSACSFIGGCVSSLGKSLVDLSSTFIEKLAPVMGVVCNIIKILAIAFDVIKPKDSVDELGAKACESNLKPEDFSTTEEYINHLKSNIKLDKEKLDNRSEIEKLAHKGIGASIVKKGIEEKSGVNMSDDFLYCVAKGNLTGSEALGLIKIFKENNLTSMEKFESFMKNTLSLSEKIQTGELIVEGLLATEENKEKTKDEIKAKITDMELEQDR